MWPALLVEHPGEHEPSASRCSGPLDARAQLRASGEQVLRPSSMPPSRSRLEAPVIGEHLGHVEHLASVESTGIPPSSAGHAAQLDARRAAPQPH